MIPSLFSRKSLSKDIKTITVSIIILWIPGLNELLGKDIAIGIDSAVFMLAGPVGSGKTMYCKEFFNGSLKRGGYGIFISSIMGERQFKRHFLDEYESYVGKFRFINPYAHELLNENDYHDDNAEVQSIYDKPSSIDNINKVQDIEQVQSNSSLRLLLHDIRKIIAEVYERIPEIKEIKPNSDYNRIYLVLDSITHLLVLYKQYDVIKFVNDLAYILKDQEVTAIFTLTTPPSIDESSMKLLNSVVEGMIETKIEEAEKEGESRSRKIRIVGINSISLPGRWIDFEIESIGKLTFMTPSTNICSLCKKDIIGLPYFYNELVFHRDHYDIYLKLVGAFGEDRVSDAGASSVNYGHFFFVDIVGLSNPTLSVRKQIEKIDVLNNMIGSSNSFKSISEKKILPTGDGMAIGYLRDMEAPLKLSLDLHNELKKYNKKIEGSEESKIGIRIGLASGSIFIVNDVNNNQNIWGPGIILARRVMDLADNGDIYIENNMAESLISLDDRYKTTLQLKGNFPVKHGSILKIYSVIT